MSDFQKHLSSLIKSAAAKRDSELGKAAGISEDIDNAEQNTQPAATGERAAENKTEAAKGTAAMTDGGAKSNPINASVDKQLSDGATAGDTAGQSGPKGAVMEPVKDADNGAEKPENKVAAANDLMKAAKEIAQELRKAAASMCDSKDKKGAPSTKKPVKKVASADAPKLDKLGQFLVACARNSGNPGLAKVAAEMDDAALADATSDELMAGLESGDVDEGAANDILGEAMEYGAIGEEDLAGADEAAAAELMQAIEAGEVSEEDAAAILSEMQGAEGMGAEGMGAEGEPSQDELAAADAAADAAAAEELIAAIESGQLGEEDAEAILAELEASGALGEMGAEDAPVAEPTPEDMDAAAELAGPEVADAIAEPAEGMDPKIAYLLSVDESSPDYIQKVATVAREYYERGAEDFDKLAADLLSKEAEPNDPPTQSEVENEAQPDTNADADQDGNAGGDASVTELTDSVKVETLEQKEAMAAVAAELGLSGDDVKNLLSVKVASADPAEALKFQYRAVLLAKAASAKAQQKKEAK